MNLKKSLLTLVGAVMLLGTSLTGGAAFAQSSVETSIKVENTACVDERPTSIGFSSQQGQFQNRDPQAPAHATRRNVMRYTDMYVNQCLGQGWTLTASVTDFHSATSSFPAAQYLNIMGDSWYAGNVWYMDSSARVPGTTGLPWGSWTKFTSAGPNLSVVNTPISKGTAESTGHMTQGFELGLLSFPNTIPGGTYEAKLTLTFTPTGP